MRVRSKSDSVKAKLFGTYLTLSIFLIVDFFILIITIAISSNEISAQTAVFCPSRSVKL